MVHHSRGASRPNGYSEDVPNPPKLDDTVTRALKDVQTVTKSGGSTVGALQGVRTFTPVNHVDHRGRVFEIYPGASEFWTDPVVYCYAFTVRAGQTKGWGLHVEKDDRYTLISGELLTILFDARLDSPTHGQAQKVTLSPQGARSLLIPAGVWHMNINVAESETFLINHPTKAYVHEKPDRLLLSWNTSILPVDVAAYFPTQQNIVSSDSCS